MDESISHTVPFASSPVAHAVVDANEIPLILGWARRGLNACMARCWEIIESSAWTRAMERLTENGT